MSTLFLRHRYGSYMYINQKTNLIERSVISIEDNPLLIIGLIFSLLFGFLLFFFFEYLLYNKHFILKNIINIIIVVLKYISIIITNIFKYTIILIKYIVNTIINVFKYTLILIKNMIIKKVNNDDMFSLGYYNQFTEINYNEMKKYYLIAIQNNCSNSMYYLGYYYQYTEINYNEMKKYYLMSTEKGNVNSMCYLGYYYQYTEINYTQMKKYYKMAILNGCLNSKNYLEEHEKSIIIKNKYCFPPNWTNIPTTYDYTTVGCILVDLDPYKDSLEFNNISYKFNKNIYNDSIKMFNKNIVKIQRVQNPMAWVSYYHKILILSERSEIKTNNIFQNANEHIMKHGPSTTDPQIIASSPCGLDCRYSEKGLYGVAAYTAEDASYSHGYRYNKTYNLAQMFIVRVAAGKIFEADNIFTNNNKEKYRNTVHPPSGYDSIRGYITVDNKALMIYQPESTYPEYLITYEK